ncbi:MAG: SRPBCC domain-containing protein [Chloroflexi bacterium]|nr:SRPBCC domain-containing protein [Chloroflexota bacterium]
MPDLKHQAPIDASPEKVYAAVATQNGMRHWWTADTKMDEKVGGKAEFGFDKRGMVFRMDITKLDAGKQVVMQCHGDHPEWAGTTLTWTIEQQDGKAMLRLNHSAWKEVTDFCASCNSMWGNLMYRLKAYVEGKNPGPQWTE